MHETEVEYKPKIAITDWAVNQAFDDIQASDFDEFRRSELAIIETTNFELHQTILLLFDWMINDLSENQAYSVMAGMLAGYHILRSLGVPPRLTAQDIDRTADRTLEVAPEIDNSLEQELFGYKVRGEFEKNYKASETLKRIPERLNSVGSKAGMVHVFLMFEDWAAETFEDR